MTDADLINLSDVEEQLGEIQEAKQPRKLNSYTAVYKLEAIKHARQGSIHSASKKFHVDRNTIRAWMKNTKKLHVIKESSPAGKFKKNVPGAGRPLKYKALDENLAIWVRERRKKKLRVSRRIIQQQAERTFNAETDNRDFKGSRGWLESFLNRHKFCLRIPTTVCQKPPVEYVQKIIDFVLYVSELRQKTRYSHIYAADETPVWMDPSAGKCIDEKGAKEVSVLTTGHDKARITVMLTARSDGYKCKPYVLLPRKRPIPEINEKFGKKLVLCWEGKSWMDDSLTEDYLKRIFGHSLFGKRLLVWDSFRCHISQATKELLKEINLDTAVIPGGCTKFVQAPDVVWNGPFKTKYQELYNIWMLNGDRMEWTASGNPRAPAMDVYLDWICQSWDSIPQEIIAKSFKDCGITSCHDGGEDDLIHCFKRHGPVPEGRSMLRDARSALKQSNLAEEIDAEEDNENGYISDQSLELDWSDELKAPNPEYHAF